METEGTSVLIDALPPNTDYVTYLMLLEYNLTREDLPVLHTLLQDEKLVVNIGWDLVQILLPLLPESEECLQDVAALGNPREVVLKVDEQLEQLGMRLADEAMAAAHAGASGDDSASDEEDKPAGSNAVLQHKSEPKAEHLASAKTLLHMLCILHPRLKTKRPSRFLETSIGPILGAFRWLAASPTITRDVLMLITTLSGSARPALPPRNSEPQVPRVAKHAAAPDPEAQDGGEEAGEPQRQRQLLRTLVTHIMALYVGALESAGNFPALAWTERFVEKRHPDRRPPFRQSCTEMFQQSEELRMRDLLVNQMLMVATGDLKLDWNALIGLLKDEPDESAEVQPSKTGSLLLLAAKMARTTQFSQSQTLHSSVFPEHDAITTIILGDTGESMSADASATTVDALLVTGWLAFDTGGLNQDGETKHDEAFNKYMQNLAALAATQEMPTLRTQAHFLMTTILHAHKSSSARLSFIDDTLQFCPFSNLKETAIGWAKTEFALATENETTESNVFARPATLDYLAQHIFVFDSSDRSLEALLSSTGFYLAALNFCYFLCTSPSLSQQLDAWGMVRSRKISPEFVEALDGYVAKYKSEIAKDTNTDPAVLLDLEMLSAGIERAREGLDALEKAQSPP